jgi:hypothetical protein
MSNNNFVCGRCIEDADLTEYVNSFGTVGATCTGCGRGGDPLVPVRELGDFMRARMELFYGMAVNHLMWVGAEGGYMGWTADTDELLFDYIGFAFTDDGNDELRRLLVESIDGGSNELWCEYSPAGEAYDASLLSDWNAFVKLVKYDRRFFFQTLHNEGDIIGHLVGQNLSTTLEELAELAAETGLLKPLNVGAKFFRARPRSNGQSYTLALELGPPPPEQALQSNRMNPPGIPMFYGSTNAALARIETRSERVSIGEFDVVRGAVILDLVELPPIPGFFSEATRRERLGLRFLHKFADLISQPVPRDERTHLDYVPTQIFTEFLRDYKFGQHKLSGITFRTATGQPGSNIVLFIDQSGVADRGAETEKALIVLTAASDA